MAITNFQTNRTTAVVENIAEERSISLPLSNMAYQGDAEAGSKSVNINFVGDISTGTYTPGTDITVSELSDSQKVLLLNQDNYFAVYIDKLNLAKSAADYMPAAEEKAGQALYNTLDTYFFGSNTYADTSIPAGNKFGSLAVPIAITSSNVLDYLDDMYVSLRDQHWEGGVFATVSPKMMSLIRKSGLATVTNNQEIWNGRTVARYADMTLIETTHITKDATADGYQVMAFSPRAIATGIVMDSVSLVDAEKRNAYLFKGFYSFGCKVVFPNEIAVLSATFA